MKNVKRLIVLVIAIGVLSLAGVAYAADIKTPADIVAALTGKSVTEINKERAAGKTYGTIANDAGKLDEFKAQMLEQKKAVLDQRVKDGILTQQQADEIYDTLKNNQALCNGTGNALSGKKCRAGFGRGAGRGQGMGNGIGYGAGMGNGGCIGGGSGLVQ